MMPSGAGREHGAFIVEPAHQDARAGADRAHDIGFRDFAILEHEFAGVRAAHAELVEFLCLTEKPLKPRSTRKAVMPLRARVRIGLGVDHTAYRHPDRW